MKNREVHQSFLTELKERLVLLILNEQQSSWWLNVTDLRHDTTTKMARKLALGN